MNNQQMIIALIKAVSGQANVLTIPRVYIDLIGKSKRSVHKEALILSQSIFWSDRSEYQNGWFRKTYDEWFDELGIHQNSLDRLVGNLIDVELMETQIAENNDKFYRPKLEILTALIEDYYSSPSPRNGDTPLPVMKTLTLDIDQNIDRASQTISEFMDGKKKPTQPQKKITYAERQEGIKAAISRGAKNDEMLTETIRKLTFREVAQNATTRGYIFDLKEWGATDETLKKCAAYCQSTLNANNWRPSYKPSLKDLWENYRASQEAKDEKPKRKPSHMIEVLSD